MASHSAILEKDELKRLLQLILEIESAIGSIERKGVVFREFLASRNAEGVLPKYQVHLNDDVFFVFSKEELNDYKVRDLEEQKRVFESIPEEERKGRVFEPASFHYLQLMEEEHLESIKKGLAEFSLTLEQYVVASGKIVDIISEGHEERPVYTLKEVVDVIRENGRKGMEIQRYKGLGEMNADQLWETTMDPAVRTLIQVNLSDAIAADQIFSMLMGEEVKPRRMFIESHALSVKNLDI
jgi:DNA gyrase subunit B